MLPRHLCPCGSQKNYDACCGLYIEQDQIPATAEILMRSRYTAYTFAHIPYIQASMRNQAAENYDPVQAERWAKSVKWKWLKVLRAFPHPTDPNLAYVEFIAAYLNGGRLEKITETSEFEQYEGKWYYVNAHVIKNL